MRRTAWLLLPMLLAGAASAAAQEWLTPEQAAAWLATAKHVHIVDVRDKEAYMAGTLKGAVHLSLAELRAMKPEPEARLLLIVGDVDPDALPTGYAGLYLLAGTPAEWHRAGLHVVRIKVSKPAFVIPRGLCEMNEPADEQDAQTVEEEWK